MIDKKTLKTAITKALAGAAFLRKGNRWYLDGDDATVEFELQKNDWDEEYFINIDISIKPQNRLMLDGDADVLLSHRLERLFPEDKLLIREGLSLSNGSAESLAKLILFIETKLIPFLRDCTKLPNLRGFAQAGRFRLGLVSKDAREILWAD